MATSSESGGSGGTDSETGSNGRVRTVKLVRRSGPSKLGFSVRGGKEHRTGFFITAVEPSSEAHLQGLLIGDQIIRVNGYPVDDATHKELLQLIQGHNSVILKVRSVGMIPVKEDGCDELSWRLVDTECLSIPQNGCHYKQDDSRPLHRLTLKVPPKAKLGCGICKGPDWKPGIFVQFTKENSIARLGGLRPGDQIVQCNNIMFTPDIPFNQAVSIMRGSGVLELLVCKGAGMELFPGESSGYNSSASSVAGDLTSIEQTAPHRVIKENGLNGVDDYNLRKKCSREAEYTNGSTIIQIGGDQPDLTPKVAEICMVSQQMETKTTTVLVEVHHSEEDTVSNTQSDVSTDRMTNTSVSSFTSSASSLSSAISQELERRSKKPPVVQTLKNKAPSHPPTEKLIKSGLTKEELDQHEKLMQEFKRAHQKMFSSSDINKLGKEKENGVITEKEKPAEKKMIIEPKKEKSKEQDVHRPRNKKQPAPPPPPPPPMPDMKEHPFLPPPTCPTPDYDTLSMSSDLPDHINNNYLSKSSTDSTHSTVVMRDNVKPLVTIREYPSGQDKRQPSRLEFLNGQTCNLPQNQPPQSRLHSELSQTLAKATLHSKEPQMTSHNINNNRNDVSKGSVIKISVEPHKESKQAPFFLFPNELNRRFPINSKENYTKTSSVPFNIKETEQKNGHHPNGILKNGATNISHVHIQNGVEKIIPHKTIKFGGITTVIRDTPEPKG